LSFSEESEFKDVLVQTVEVRQKVVEFVPHVFQAGSDHILMPYNVNHQRILKMTCQSVDFQMEKKSRKPRITTIKIEQILISLIIGNSEGGFRSRDERKRAEKM
jgi:hypothetical protein